MISPGVAPPPAQITAEGNHGFDPRGWKLETIDTLDDERWLSTNQLAQWLGVSPQTLKIWPTVDCKKCVEPGQGRGPPYSKISRNCIRYKVSLVKEWIARRREQETIEHEKRRRNPRRFAMTLIQ